MMHLSSVIRAFSVLLIGMALFLSGCADMPPVEAPSPGLESREHYSKGLELMREGFADRAMEAFHAAVDADPTGDVAPAAMFRIAGLYRDRGDHHSAFSWLQRLEEGFPGHENADESLFLKVETLVSLGAPGLARTAGISWAETYEGHLRYPEMSAIIADASLQTGDSEGGFKWWLQAYKTGRDDPDLRARATKKLTGTVEELDVGELAAVSGSAAGTRFEPMIYQHMAEGYLSTGDMDRAEEAAMALVRSSPEDRWAVIGKDILDRIRVQLSVKGNLVGCILPQSGAFELYGRELLQGIHLGLAMEAQKAGSAGRLPAVEVVIEDSAGDPSTAGEAMVRLAMEDKVIAVVGPLSSGAAEVVGEKSQKLGVPLMAVTQREGMTEAGDMVFRNFIHPSREIERLLDGSMGALSMDRFAVLYPENSYGRHFNGIFRDAVESRGGSITAVAGYDPGTTDFADHIKKLVGLDSPRPRSVEEKLHAEWPAEREEMEAYPEGPQPVVDFDAVFIPDTFEVVAMLAPQLIYHDVTEVLLLGTSLWQSQELLDQAAGHVQGAMFASGFFEGAGRPGVSSFVNTYRKWFGTDPGILAATGYDTIRFLAGLLAEEGAGTRINLRLAIAESPPFHGITGDISFDETGEVEKKPFLLTVHGRNFMEF